jgi:hypothetical protein
MSYLIIFTDRESGYMSLEYKVAPNRVEIIVYALQQHTKIDVRRLIELDEIDEHRNQISEENGIEVSIVELETKERIL